MHRRKRYKHISLQFNDTSLSLSDHCKYLGVILQSNLKWNRHIEETIAGTNSILGLLRRHIKVASTYVKDLAYRALIRPKLEYASVVWSPWQQFTLKKFSVVQLAMSLTITALIPV